MTSKLRDPLDALGGWTSAGNTLSIDSVLQVQGTGCLKLTATAAADQLASDTLSIGSPKDHLVQVWFRIEAAAWALLDRVAFHAADSAAAVATWSVSKEHLVRRGWVHGADTWGRVDFDLSAAPDNPGVADLDDLTGVVSLGAQYTTPASLPLGTSIRLDDLRVGKSEFGEIIERLIVNAQSALGGLTVTRGLWLAEEIKDPAIPHLFVWDPREETDIAEDLQEQIVTRVRLRLVTRGRSQASTNADADSIRDAIRADVTLGGLVRWSYVAEREVLETLDQGKRPPAALDLRRTRVADLDVYTVKEPL